MINLCIDCGVTPTGGLRCRKCHGRFEAEQAAVALADQDDQILQMRDVEKLSERRIGERMGWSRAWARQKIAAARRRLKVRQAMAERIA